VTWSFTLLNPANNSETSLTDSLTVTWSFTLLTPDNNSETSLTGSLVGGSAYS
jgi:hypothetical protein